MRAGSVLSRAIEFRSHQLSPKTTLLVSVVATFIVLAFSFWSIRSLDLQWSDINRRAAALCLFVGFFQVPLNATEYILSSRLAGTEIGVRQAVRTTTVASAANILPIPAGAMVRIQALRVSGAGTGSSIAGTSAIATIWLAVSACLGSVALVQRQTYGPLVGFVLLFVAALALSSIAVRNSPNRDVRLIAAVVLLETAYVCFAAARFWLALRTLNVDASVSASFVISCGSPVASAAGIVPGAIGVLEGLAAGAAELVDVPGSAGFLAAALLRGFGFLISAVTLLFLGIAQLRRPSATPRRLESHQHD